MILFVIFIVIFCFASFSFDRIILYQHQNYHEEWKLDGRPRGMFVNPKGASMLGFWVMGFKIWKCVPEWAENDVCACSLFRRLFFWKRVGIIYSLLFIPLIIIFSS